MLAQALSLSPGHPTILTEIAAVWRRSGNAEQALVILDAMVKAGLDHAPTWLERGHALSARNAWGKARDSYERAARLDPRSAPALAGMTDSAARMGDITAARAFGDRALRLDPANIVAANAVAAIEIEAREPERARVRLETLLDKVPMSDPGLVETLSHLGDACHALGRHDEAFTHYSAAQANYRRMAMPKFGDERRGQTALIRHVHDQLDRLDPATWPAGPLGEISGAAERHVFLLGYPRSGTTMVENVLASAPGVVALEEKPTMIATEPLLASEAGIATLGELAPGTIDGLRAAYWRAVAEQGVDVSGKTFVDMNPIRGFSLPIIARLFPEARIVVMRRDPRDVVWSCFRRHFTLSATGFVFSDLESAARHYDALMSLTEACLDRMPVRARVAHYEELVVDFDRATRSLCDFVGMDWIPEMREFGRTALQRGVTTASLRQVRQGLFNGTGQWRPYADHLAPVLPILQPWVSRFRYGN